MHFKENGDIKKSWWRRNKVMCISIAQGQPLLIYFDIFPSCLFFPNIVVHWCLLELTVDLVPWMEYKCQLYIFPEEQVLGYTRVSYALECSSLDSKTYYWAFPFNRASHEWALRNNELNSAFWYASALRWTSHRK